MASKNKPIGTHTQEVDEPNQQLVTIEGDGISIVAAVEDGAHEGVVSEAIYDVAAELTVRMDADILNNLAARRRWE